MFKKTQQNERARAQERATMDTSHKESLNIHELIGHFNTPSIVDWAINVWEVTDSQVCLIYLWVINIIVFQYINLKVILKPAQEIIIISFFTT